jgi:hypothetical protein
MKKFIPIIFLIFLFSSCVYNKGKTDIPYLLIYLGNEQKYNTYWLDSIPNNDTFDLHIKIVSQNNAQIKDFMIQNNANKDTLFYSEHIKCNKDTVFSIVPELKSMSHPVYFEFKFIAKTKKMQIKTERLFDLKVLPQ